MKKVIALIIALCFFSSMLNAADNGLISIKSRFPVMQTTDRLIGLIEKKDLTMFKLIKHSENAKSAGIKIQPTELIIFGNPKVGSPLMKCAPTIAIDLPQKFLIWQDKNKQTWITYNSPIYVADRHALPSECRGSLHKIAMLLQTLSRIAGDSQP